MCSDRLDWVLVYDLASDVDRIRGMQAASLGESNLGLAPDPLVGSDEWWEQIERGDRPVRSVEGRIDQVYWGSMGDWPEFRVAAQDGTFSSWTREGDVRRFVQGLCVRLTYVEHDYKVAGALSSDKTSRVVLRIEVEDSPWRSSAIAPGPGGHGYEVARRRGDAVHYVISVSQEAASRLAGDLEAEGLTALVFNYAGGRAWAVSVWHRDESAAARWREELILRSVGYGARYDGGEIVGGTVWGPA